jgi:hypothetical protein
MDDKLIKFTIRNKTSQSNKMLVSWTQCQIIGQQYKRTINKALRKPEIKSIIILLHIWQTLYTVMIWIKYKLSPLLYLIYIYIYNIKKSNEICMLLHMNCGGHLGGRVRLPDTILEEDHPMTIPSKFGSNWATGSRQDGFYVNFP